MLVRRVLALAMVSSSLAACGALIGIDDELGVDAPPVAPIPDGGPAPEVGPMRDAADGPIILTGDAAASAKRAFLTSTGTNGILNGVVGADARCVAAANAAGLGGGPWIAWISGDGVSAIDRIKHAGAYQLLDGRRVVANKAQLTTGHLDTPIDFTEKRQIASSNEPWVWTGTLANGQSSAGRCNDWTTSYFATLGAAGSFDQSTDGKWTDNGGPGGGFRNWGCQSNGRLYCFEQ